MAEALTYNSLVQDIKDYAERSDDPFVNQIPRFIMMAENRIASESKPFGFVRTVTGTLNGPVLEKPIRWRHTKSFALKVMGKWQYLYDRGYEYCRVYWPDVTLVDVPKYYADYDFEHFFLCPSPMPALQFELQYYERPTPLSAENQTNWVTQYAPQLLVYGAMLEAMPFLKTSERIPEFQGLYDRALQAITKEDTGRILDQSAVRSTL